MSRHDGFHSHDVRVMAEPTLRGPAGVHCWSMLVLHRRHPQRALAELPDPGGVSVLLIILL